MRNAPRESESNVLRLIACDPVNSATKHGLTLNGRQQVLKSAGIFASEHESKPIIISSDFYEQARQPRYWQRFIR